MEPSILMEPRLHLPEPKYQLLRGHVTIAPLPIIDWRARNLYLYHSTINDTPCMSPKLALSECKKTKFLPHDCPSRFSLHIHLLPHNRGSGWGSLKPIHVVATFYLVQATPLDQSLARNHRNLSTIHPHRNTHNNSLRWDPIISKDAGS